MIVQLIATVLVLAANARSGVRFKRSDEYSSNCKMAVREFRRVEGHCALLAGRHTACVSADSVFLDPFNSHCPSSIADQLVNNGSDRIGCVIDKEISRDVVGHCTRLGRIPACNSFDETFTELFNGDCLSYRAE